MSKLGVAEIEEVRTQAAQSEESHVIGLSTERDRRIVEQAIRPYFRFLWLNARLLGSIPHDVEGFIGALNGVLEQEELWAERVKPRSLPSPLLLPACSFGTDRPHANLWALAEQFGEVGNILGAADAIEAFKERYWIPASGPGHYPSPRRWVDRSSLVFDHTGQRHHKKVPFPRDWKYSFRIEDGFHYDVNERDKGAFILHDAWGHSHSVPKRGHLNVDPHGIVLGSD